VQWRAVQVRSDQPLSARRRGVRTSWCARVPRAPAATATAAALGVATPPTARAMFQASPCGVVEAPERTSTAGRRPASQVCGAGRARRCRTRRTGCLNAVSMLSQCRLIVVSLLRLAAPSGRTPRTRVARAPCAAMSSEGWLPRDKLLDGGLFDSLELLLSPGPRRTPLPTILTRYNVSGALKKNNSVISGAATSPQR